MPTDRASVERLMKRCQIGVGGRGALDAAHDILAECYGALGALLDEVERVRAENKRLSVWVVEYYKAMREAILRKDAQIDDLRAENEKLRALLRECDAIAREHGGCDLWDAIDNHGVLYQSQALADALKEPNAKHEPGP